MSEEKNKPKHKEKFENAKDLKIPTELANELSRIFKVLGDPTRVKILSALSEGELCVHDISLLLNLSQSAVSHQLRKLRDSRIVKSRKSGRTVFYSLDDEHIEKLLEMGIDHVKER